jgi:hypothetical protein
MCNCASSCNHPKKGYVLNYTHLCNCIKAKERKQHKDPCGKRPKQNSKRQKRPEKKFAINGKKPKGQKRMHNS